MTAPGLDLGFMTLNETTIAVLAGLLVFVSVLALGNALLPHDPMASRLRSHQKRREQLRAGLIAGSTASDRKRASVGQLKRLLDRLQMLRGDEARKTSDLLAQAGWRSRDALVIYLGSRLTLPFVGAIAAMFVLVAFMPQATGMNKLLGVLAGRHRFRLRAGLRPQAGDQEAPVPAAPAAAGRARPAGDLRRGGAQPRCRAQPRRARARASPAPTSPTSSALPPSSSASCRTGARR